ncbi:MAG: type II 3-dehydroquinate dehydratase [Candidatus Neomarinimicrobiota bacterium]|jgi:3-dehydroquinate dehydratase-2|nr:type II 3-dehydroquinate dehydratase [Candidatus Neomarinimicrobiota bacterium]
MNILIVQGPNLNLIGLRSAKSGDQITLDKINRNLRKQANKRPEDLTVKILQTHKIEKAMTTIHRNRRWANGIILAPMAWARYEYALRDCLDTVAIPTIEVFLADQYESEEDKVMSILSAVCMDSMSGHPLSIFTDALDRLVNHLT